jgi:hypothetical protein
MAESLFRISDEDSGSLEKDRPGTKASRNLVTLQSLLNPRSTKIISKKIFSNNESEFMQFIRHLESYQSWQESLKLIETELQKRKVKENDQSAILLTNIVYRRYFPHDDGVKID